MNIVLDTNILKLLIRDNNRAKEQLSKFGVFNPANLTTMSIASVGEFYHLLYKTTGALIKKLP